MPPTSWKFSLHGAHSGTFCDHARGRLEEFLQSAIARGFHTLGISEHAPRVEPARLYEEERAMGWTVDTLWRKFTEYSAEVERLAGEYATRITVLKGFECEIVPQDTYVELMSAWKRQFNFQYIVGSVHYVRGHIIDYTRARFEDAVNACGGLEDLAICYYEHVYEMVSNLCPEVVAHLDLPRRFGGDHEALASPRVQRAAERALQAIAEKESLLEVNTAAYRKGLPTPYPAPWLLQRARDYGIGFTLGDDSHAPEEVGYHFDEARRYLLQHGITRVFCLRPAGGRVERVALSLE